MISTKSFKNFFREPIQTGVMQNSNFKAHNSDTYLIYINPLQPDVAFFLCPGIVTLRLNIAGFFTLFSKGRSMTNFKCLPRIYFAFMPWQLQHASICVYFWKKLAKFFFEKSWENVSTRINFNNVACFSLVTPLQKWILFTYLLIPKL